jgi:glucans biosynthesis protein C
MRPDVAAGPAGPPERRYDLDWLRVSVFLLLILYHVGMFFVPWSWHIKNPEPAGAWLQVPMFLVSQWRLSLLFLVSGAAVHFALRRRSRGQFIRERFTRLFIPLVFGMLVVVPPQVYYERLTQGATYTSYLAFLPDAFTGGPYPEGNVSWHHLWFVAYALVFALAALPLFQWFRCDRGRRLVDGWAAWLQRPGRVFALALPVAASEVSLRPSWPSTHALVGDWANLASYFLIFVCGFILYSRPAFGQAIERQRRVALVLGVVATAGLVAVWQAGHITGAGYSAGYLSWVAAKAFNTWFWLIALVGYARRYLNVRSEALRHANEAVYPFYILHQTVIIVIAYHLTEWTVAVPLKFAVISVGTLASTTALYLLIRATPVTRALFGMKPRRVRNAAIPVAASVVAREIRAWR